MKLAIFGSTGRTGSALQEKALEAGHEVTAIVRNPSKLTRYEHLTVVQGDADDQSTVELAVQGMDAVVSVMSASASQKNAKNKTLTSGIQNIIRAMKKHGVNRLIMTAPNSIPLPEDKPDIRFKLLNRIVRFLVPTAYRDTIGSMEAAMSSDLNWTIVRMGRAAYVPPTGRVQSGCLNKNMGIRITRADAADFILNEAMAGKFIRQSPAICSLKKI